MQVGSRILNVAAINAGGSAGATPWWYDFNIGVIPHTLRASYGWKVSNTSSDWHPSINANTVGRFTARSGRSSGRG